MMGVVRGCPAQMEAAAMPAALAFIVLILTSAEPAHAQAEASDPALPLVRTAAGVVRGRWVAAERGANLGFDAYLGIPYASPPVGPLRFKSPKPIQPWTGVLNATSDPPVCAQIDVNSESKGVIGQEDCLYLNVYVPEETTGTEQGGTSAATLPVIFVVHGGAFAHGSGRMDAFGPHFLVTQRVIVVAINARLGPFGFLSLDSDEIPGNAGLKDIVAALTWVRSNIAAFGGDPARVTALGYSTGASAVHILSLLQKPRELFSRAILLAGHAISPRAYSERHIERAETLASVLGAPDNASRADVTRTLMEATVESLLRGCDNPRMRALGLPLPSPERRASAAPEPKLLKQDPESLLRRPEAAPIPVLLGLAEREGILPYKIWGLDARTPEAIDELLPRLLPADVIPGADTASALGLTSAGASWRGPGPLGKDASLRLAQLVRDEYSAGGAIANNIDTLIEFLGDVFIYASSWRAVGFMANATTEAAPLYLYKFAVDDAYNYAKKLYGVSMTGATHVDDLGYLARFDNKPELDQTFQGTGVAAKTAQLMVKIATNFAKALPPIESWPSVRAGSSEWPLLQIGPKLRRTVEHAVGPHYPHRAFWESVYRDFRSKTPTIGRS